MPEDQEIKHLVIWSSRHLVISERAGTAIAFQTNMGQQSEALKERTMSFSANVLRFIDQFPRGVGSEVIARQLAKSATSVAANYRSACTARSRRDFIAKLAIVVEEAEESVYWLDLVDRISLVSSQSLAHLRGEAVELRAIFSRSLSTTRMNSRVLPEITK